MSTESRRSLAVGSVSADYCVEISLAVVSFSTAAVNVTLVAFADAVRRAAVLSLSPLAGRPAANPPHAAAAVDRWDRQRDGRTDTRPLHIRILCERCE